MAFNNFWVENIEWLGRITEFWRHLLEPTSHQNKATEEKHDEQGNLVTPLVQENDRTSQSEEQPSEDTMPNISFGTIDYSSTVSPSARAIMANVSEEDNIGPIEEQPFEDTTDNYSSSTIYPQSFRPPLVRDVISHPIITFLTSSNYASDAYQFNTDIHERVLAK
jgi:hypothetical protein